MSFAKTVRTQRYWACYGDIRVREETERTPGLRTNDLLHLCGYRLLTLSKHCPMLCFGEPHKHPVLVCGTCSFWHLTLVLSHLRTFNHAASAAPTLTLPLASNSYLILRTKLESYLFSEAFLEWFRKCQTLLPPSRLLWHLYLSQTLDVSSVPCVCVLSLQPFPLAFPAPSMIHNWYLIQI